MISPVAMRRNSGRDVGVTQLTDIIEDYERCLEIWRAVGTDDCVLLPAMSRIDALRFRSRLYRIRDAMRRQQHPYYEGVANATISVFQVDTGVGGEELWALSINPLKTTRPVDPC